jgi:excisionase family DNA binding protein
VPAVPAADSLPPVLDGRSFATVAEAAGVLRVDARTVRRAITEGLIPATKTGREYRVPVEWLRDQAAKAAR